MVRKRRPETDSRLARGRAGPEARFPVAPSRAALPEDYAAALAAIKSRIQQERLRVVLSANAAMVLLYWDIGRMILTRQASAGWGAKVIDRLAADIGQEFPDMKGFSPRNLKYMRAFAAAWPDRAIVQRVIAQLPWRQKLALLERLDDRDARLWYAQETLRHGWSQPILCMQIDARAYARRQPAHGRGDRGGAVGEAAAVACQQRRAGESAAEEAMNLAIRGIDAQIAHGDTFHNDRHPDLEADRQMANAEVRM